MLIFFKYAKILTMFDYEIKIAETKQEKEAAFRLRFDVFKKELGCSFSSESLETDIYDNYCDHLIVIDRTKNLVVGTYRLLLGSRVNPKIGFYSEKIFDIKNIKKLKEEKLELSRSCIHQDYREGIIIHLLWNGIAKYIKENSVRYVFGSVRLNSIQPQDVSNSFSLIKQKYYAPLKFRVYPLKKCGFKELDKKLKITEHKEVFLKLPALVKGYLRSGVKICGEPAWNPDFGSVVFFILLDIENMSNKYRRHFLNL
ncbi:MAG: GNAT family N-acetyltransferase [Candidatus Omnitrophica bacterium]|nr:GNAT family N-acetyltransferase [Candidatus Omnitrophota bacterium]